MQAKSSIFRLSLQEETDIKKSLYIVIEEQQFYDRMPFSARDLTRGVMIKVNSSSISRYRYHDYGPDVPLPSPPKARPTCEQSFPRLKSYVDNHEYKRGFFRGKLFPLFSEVVRKIKLRKYTSPQ